MRKIPLFIRFFRICTVKDRETTHRMFRVVSFIIILEQRIQCQDATCLWESFFSSDLQSIIRQMKLA